MSRTKILAAATAFAIGIASLGASVEGASAATAKHVPKNPFHLLVCKPGSLPALVKVKSDGKTHWVWKCVKIKLPMMPHVKHHAIKPAKKM
jgi:hypothetical protein